MITTTRKGELNRLAERIEDRVLGDVERFQEEQTFEAWMAATSDLTWDERLYLAAALGVEP